MKKHLAIVLGMTLASSAAIANEGKYDKTDPAAGEATAMKFENLDVNKDRLISEKEATDSKVLDSEAFASADANQDGSLSRTEFDASVGMDTGKTGLDVETKHQDEVLEDDAG